MSFLNALFATIAATVATIPVVTYGAFLLHNGLPLPGRHTARRLAALAEGMCQSVGAFCMVVAALPFRRRCRLPLQPEASAGDAGPHVPVLFVHGLYHNPSAWLLYRPTFARQGIGPEHTFGYDSFSNDFATLVHQLDAAVDALIQAHPATPPILIGHSLGGLIIRAWLSRHDGARRCSGVVTLGTPHQGSALARLGIGNLARSLLFRGTLVQTVERHEAAPGVPCVAIRSPLDNMVIPAEGLRIRAHGWTEVEGPAVSHVWMLWDARTRTLVLETARRIRDGLPVT